MRQKTVEERFWEKVNKDGPIPEHRPELGKCWIWTASLHSSGYGNFRLGGVLKAHRVSWELTNGAIPEDLCCLHKCDFRPCVRTDHLFLGTIADNNADKEAKGRAIVLKGERHFHKITAEEVCRIRSEYANGARSQKGLAKQYGVTQAIVSKIIRGQIWKCVPLDPIILHTSHEIAKTRGGRRVEKA